MKYIKITLLLLSLLSSMPVIANDLTDSSEFAIGLIGMSGLNPYASSMIGITNYKANNHDSQANNALNNYQQTQALSYSFQLGWMLLGPDSIQSSDPLPGIGLEIGYLNYGKANWKDATGANISTRISAKTLDLQLIMPIKYQINVYGKIGLADGSITASNSAYSDSHALGLDLEAGIAYQFKNHLRLSLLYHTTHFHKTNNQSFTPSVIGLGLSYNLFYLLIPPG